MICNLCYVAGYDMLWYALKYGNLVSYGMIGLGIMGKECRGGKGRQVYPVCDSIWGTSRATPGDREGVDALSLRHMPEKPQRGFITLCVDPICDGRVWFPIHQGIEVGMYVMLCSMFYDLISYDSRSEDGFVLVPAELYDMICMLWFMKLG